jgi:hypothetical protein
MCSWWCCWNYHPKRRASNLEKYRELYIVASCWTITDITCKMSRFINYCGFCLHTTPAANRSRESFSFKCTETLTIGSSPVSMALQSNFWPWSCPPPPSPPPSHLPQVFTLPCCSHPVLFQEKFWGIPPHVTLPSTSRPSSFQTLTNYFWGDSRFLTSSRTTLSWSSLPIFFRWELL